MSVNLNQLKNFDLRAVVSGNPSRTRNMILKILRPRSCDRSENILNYS